MTAAGVRSASAGGKPVSLLTGKIARRECLENASTCSITVEASFIQRATGRWYTSSAPFSCLGLSAIRSASEPAAWRGRRGPDRTRDRRCRASTPLHKPGLVHVPGTDAHLRKWFEKPPHLPSRDVLRVRCRLTGGVRVVERGHLGVATAAPNSGGQPNLHQLAERMAVAEHHHGRAARPQQAVQLVDRLGRSPVMKATDRVDPVDPSGCGTSSADPRSTCASASAWPARRRRSRAIPTGPSAMSRPW